MRILLALLFAVASLLAEPVRPVPGDWLVFASLDCEECAWLQLECLPRLADRLGQAPPRTLLFAFETEGNYETLVAVEDALGVSGDGVPVLLAGNRLLYGKETIAAWAETLTPADLAVPLPGKVLPVLAKGTPVVYAETEARAAPPRAVPETGRESARVLYFRTPGCPSCALADTRLDHLSRRFPEVAVQRFTADSPEIRYLQYALAKRLDVPSGKRLVTPMVVSDHAALYETIGDASLAELLENAPADPFWRDWDRDRELAAAKREIETLVRGFSVVAILLAGLVDGVNPCAFAVIVFLVSYLGLSRRGGRRAALVFGLLFNLGVFLCYFLIGLGLSALLDHLHGHRGIIRVVFAGMGGLCLVFAVFAIWDTLRARREGAAAMRFGMPKSFHRVAHTLIRNQAGRGVLGLGTVLLGMVVSTIELVCTGQIYFPALVLMNQAGRNARSLALLLAYNLAFIAPLVLVVLLAAYGVGSQQLAAWARRHAALTRALTAVLFLALAILLFVLAARG